MRITGPVLIAVALAITSCGVSDEDEALKLARAACERAPAAPGQVATEVDEARIAAGYEESADQAAKAARLDPTWDELSTAYVALAEGFGLLATLPLDASGRYVQSRATEQQRAQLAEVLPRAVAAEPTVRAQCRKASD